MGTEAEAGGDIAATASWTGQERGPRWPLPSERLLFQTRTLCRFAASAPGPLAGESGSLPVRRAGRAPVSRGRTKTGTRGRGGGF